MTTGDCSQNDSASAAAFPPNDLRCSPVVDTDRTLDGLPWPDLNTGTTWKAYPFPGHRLVTGKIKTEKSERTNE